MQCHETHALHKTELQLIISAASQEPNEYRRRRDILILNLLWKTSQRIGAILQLQTQDIDLVENKIIFMPEKSKTKQYHEVLISDELKDQIEEYMLRFNGSIATNNNYLFFTERASTAIRHFNIVGFWYRFHIYAAKAGKDLIRWVTPRGRKMHAYHPHTIRGGVITHLLEQGESFARVMKLSGHKTIECVAKHYNKLIRYKTQQELIQKL